jgi:hypothetical protein
MLQQPKEKKITLQRITNSPIEESQLRDTDCGKVIVAAFLQVTDKAFVVAFWISAGLLPCEKFSKYKGLVAQGFSCSDS